MLWVKLNRNCRFIGPHGSHVIVWLQATAYAPTHAQKHNSIKTKWGEEKKQEIKNITGKI